MVESALMEKPVEEEDNFFNDFSDTEEKLHLSYLDKDEEELLSQHFLETPQEAEADRQLLEEMYAQESASPRDSGRTARFKSDKRKRSPLSQRGSASADKIEAVNSESSTTRAQQPKKSIAKIKREKQAKMIVIIGCIVMMIGCILGILYKYDYI